MTTVRMLVPLGGHKVGDLVDVKAEDGGGALSVAEVVAAYVAAGYATTKLTGTLTAAAEESSTDD